MSSRKLKNYLRTHRKRHGLSQEHIAYLLDCDSGANVSKHEHFHREPTLQTALAYEVVFQTPLRELFAGTFHDVEQKIQRRMKRLVKKLGPTCPSCLVESKRSQSPPT
jgi:DNA-binding XRE family transcriptional regulator